MYRFATVGSNFIVDWFLEEALKRDDLVYQAAYSRSEKKAQDLQKKYGCKKTYTNLELMAQDEEIDFVYLASPNFLHRDQTILMLNHKKHVLCEKPLASNYREAVEMYKLADEKNLILMEAMRNRHTKGYRALEKNLYKLGQIRRASFNYCQYSSRYDKFKEGIVENAFNPKLSNGALMDIGVYLVHPMVALFGRPLNLVGHGINLSNGVDGAGDIIFIYDSMVGNISYSKINDSKLASEIQGEDASLIIDRLDDIGLMEIVYRDGSREKIDFTKEESKIAGELDDFIKILQGKEKVDLYKRESLDKMCVLDGIRNQLNIVFPGDKF